MKSISRRSFLATASAGTLALTASLSTPLRAQPTITMRTGAPAALAWRAGHLHRPAVSSNNGLDDGEAQSDTAGVPREILIDAIETPEDPPLLPGGDADAVVDHGKSHVAVVTCGPNLDSRIGR